MALLHQLNNLPHQKCQRTFSSTLQLDSKLLLVLQVLQHAETLTLKSIHILDNVNFPNKNNHDIAIPCMMI